jgi:hypothetical protein
MVDQTVESHPFFFRDLGLLEPIDKALYIIIDLAVFLPEK